MNAFRNGVFLGDISFSPNGTSTPDSTYTRGSLKGLVSTITYSATGKYVVTFTSKFRFPATPNFKVGRHIEDLTNWFDAVVLGSYDSTNRQLTIQTHRSGTAGGAGGAAVQASSGAARITLAVYAVNSGVRNG
jgi:hypothetical protein